MPGRTLLSQHPWYGAGLAFLSGLLVPLSMAPFNWWPLGIVALVGLLFSIDKQSIRHTSIRFYLFNLGMFGLGVSWIYVSINTYGGASAALAGFLVLLFVCAWSLIGLLQGYIYGRWLGGSRPGQWPIGVVLGFPALWILVEMFRGWFLTGFPWLYLGYGQMQSPLANYAPYGGVFLVSLAVLLSATFLYMLITSTRLVWLLPLTIIWLAAGLLSQIDLVTERKTISVAAVQGDIDQHSKWRRNMVVPIIDRYLELTESEWGTDLIVWPEASVTLFRQHAAPLITELAMRGKQSKSTLVLGIPDRDQDGNFLNTAIATGAGSGRYNKRQLVPFGEYVPLENWLRGIITFFDLPMSHNSPGEDVQDPLLAGDLRLSLSICYEVAFPNLVRTTTDDPDLLVTISNDTWFGASIGPDQHLQMAQMRALENGRYMLRATNNGITALIDHRGHLVATLPRNEANVLHGRAQIMTGNTPFSLFGPWPVLLLCLAMLFVARMINPARDTEQITDPGASN